LSHFSEGKEWPTENERLTKSKGKFKGRTAFPKYVNFGKWSRKMQVDEGTAVEDGTDWFQIRGPFTLSCYAHLMAMLTICTQNVRTSIKGRKEINYSAKKRC
jgi:hypothetical protein